MTFFLLISPFLVSILPLKPPCTIIIVSRGTPLVPLSVAGHSGCWNIFRIWNNNLLSNPFWKFICGLLGWVTTGYSSLWPSVFLYMAMFATLVTSRIWLDRWPSSRATTISTRADLEVNLLQRLFDRLLNVHSVRLQNRRLLLRLLFAASQFPLLWIGNVSVFMCILLYKVLIGY